MTEEMDQKTYRMMMEVLARMKADFARQEQKRQDKLWAEIALPLRLRDALGRLTKDDLTSIRQALELERVSGLKKHELIDVLIAEIPSRAQQLFHLFDFDRYKLVKKIVENGGFTYGFKPDAKIVDYLRNIGLVFPCSTNDRKALAVPRELWEVFRQMDTSEYQKIIRWNSRVIRLTQGLLYYYGTLSVKELISMIGKYTGEMLDYCEYLYLLQEAALCYEEIHIDASGVSNYRVWDAEQVKREHRLRPDVDYYPFTEAQLIEAGAPGFVDRNNAYMGIVQFIRNNYQISKQASDEIVEECVYAIRIGDSLPDIMEYLQSQLEIDSLETAQAFADHVAYLVNNTRQWFIKGYTPAELAKKTWKHHKRDGVKTKGEIIDFNTRQKIGRNDLCPCGSGKKYKKCCGR